MSDILTAMICGEDMHLLGKDVLEPPYSQVEQDILDILQTLDRHTAWKLRDCIQFLVLIRHIEAFRSGIRLGVQLAAELTEDTAEAR